jgi:hypothetical protein
MQRPSLNKVTHAECTLTPILIGITGKRDLCGKDEAVRRAIAAAFDLLDKVLPASTKVLLTGLAAGADGLGAEEALHRPNWRVVAVLPFERTLYAQDFDDEGALLERMLGHPLVTTRILEPLCGRDGKPLTPAELARVEGQQNLERTAHYEQAGLFIAERCALLIAVKPASELPGRVGGTARIVASRLNEPDATAHSVIARSSELKPRAPLEASPTGPVWLIDLETVDHTHRSPLNAVAPLHPTKSGVEAGEARPSTAWRRTALIDSLELASGLDRLNNRVAALPKRRRQAMKPTDPRPGGLAAPASTLDRVRRGLSFVQQGYMWRLRCIVLLMAILFVVAAILLECHIEYARKHFILMIYLLALQIMFGLFAWARMHRWQRFAEDYRAAAEALRVQIAWWDAGLIGPYTRVDRLFLCGTRGSLALVRAAIAHFTDAASLTAHPQPAPHLVTRWIESQVSFFTRRSEDRRRLVKLLDRLSEGTLYAAFGVWLGQLVANAQSNAECLPLWLTALGILLTVGVLVARKLRNRRPGAGNVYLMVAAIVIMTTITKLLLLGSDPEHQKLVSIVAVGLVAIAGAARFVAERLAFDAEAARYPEALAIFRRAQQGGEVTARVAGAKMEPAAEENNIYTLGRKALEETEFWLRAHRIRRLLPQP